MPKEDHLEFNGEVVDSCRDIFRVKTELNHIVSCKLGGPLRKNSIKVLVGDFVKIEVSPYETTKGIIVFRHKS